MNKRDKGVHIAHCCLLHGCKYGNEDCPVEKGEVEQAYLCENCGEEGLTQVADIKAMIQLGVRKCHSCGSLYEVMNPHSLRDKVKLLRDLKREVNSDFSEFRDSCENFSIAKGIGHGDGWFKCNHEGHTRHNTTASICTAKQCPLL